MAKVILLITNPQSGGVYTPQTSKTKPSASALEVITVDVRSIETILQGVVKPLGKALKFSAAQRNAAVANTSKFGVQVDPPWRILETTDPSIHAVVAYSYAPDPNDTKARREQLPILNSYSLLPVSLRKKEGHLYLRKACSTPSSAIWRVTPPQDVTI